MRLTIKLEDLIKHVTLHDVGGTVELVEGLDRTKTGLPWTKKKIPSLESHCRSPLGLQPAGLTCRFWIYQALAFSWPNL